MEYTHLTLEERTLITTYMQKGQLIKATARAVERSATTIQPGLARRPWPYEIWTMPIRP